ncbi:hypothetical protein [Ferrimonas balearica]|uniref:hypothetical protein n=1 Tax=Ferrimonas balearica TaxID=44012 RepID=UPI001C945616|nr:hypothetical protein [Ferrimonas balearica]MBY5979642.1 hypothetical protein [Ferrimonas balearica]
MSRPTTIPLILAALLSFSAAAEVEQDALLSLQGKWQGHWRGQNLDSGDVSQTSVRVSIDLTEDGQWLEERITTPQAQFSQRVETVSPYRIIQQFEHAEYEQDRLLTGFHYVSDEVWILRFEFSANRQQRPVKVQQIWRRLPGAMSREEQVDYLDDKGENWLTRQTLVLEQLPAETP